MAQHDTAVRFRKTFDQAAVGLAHISPEGRWLEVNHKLCTLTGYAETELHWMTVHQVIHPDDHKTDDVVIGKLLLGQPDHHACEKRLLRKDGADIWVKIISSLARLDDGTPLHYVLVIDDISHRKAEVDQARHLASHDSLTGLPNRRELQLRLEGILKTASLYKKRVACVFIDMDGLKPVHDRLGHAAGNKLIMELARHLLSSTRPADTVARIGGDEFVLIVPDAGSDDNIATLAGRVQEALMADLDGNSGSLSLACSIGVSVFPDNALNGETLIDKADAAMYRAKREGGARFHLFAS